MRDCPYCEIAAEAFKKDEAKIARLSAAISEILGERTMAEILWKGMPDDEMVTITMKLGKYRAAFAALDGDGHRPPQNEESK